jgi:DNA-binding LacI/PurR family transcriptional regulator
VTRPSPQSGPTLEQVAAVAGVSRSTVSRVVNDHPKVSPQAREAVERAVVALGYVPNRAARSLATRRTSAIALVIREPEPGVLEEPFFAGVLRAVSRAARGADLQLVLLVEPPDEVEGFERSLVGGLAAGVILLSVHADDTLPARLVARGVPIVVSGRLPAESPPIDSVDADNVQGGRLATEHLIERGRHRIGVIAGPSDMTVALDRRAGATAAREDAGVDADPGLEVVGDFTHAGGATAAEHLLARRPDVDAIVAPSDLAALGAMRTLAATGRHVPDDVAVTGFDDSVLAEVASPPLTSVRQPVDRIGAELAKLLLAQLGADPPAPGERVVLGTELVVRGSS